MDASVNQAIEDVEVFGDVAVEEVYDEAMKTVEEELEELFGGPKAEAGPSRNYGADMLRAVQQVADDLAASVSAVLPPDVGQVVQENALVVLLVLAVACLALIYAMVRASARGPRRTAVLLCGPQGGGKTTLLYALRGTPLPQGSVTSMQATSLTFAVPLAHGQTRPVEVIDVPGHPRMRSLLSTHSRRARGVVFVVDAVEFVKQKAVIAEQLYDTLVMLAASSVRVPLVLACNKADQGSRAFTRDFVVSQLEKDIVGLRQTRLASLGKDQSHADDQLCKGGAAFSLATCSVPFSACSISAKTGDLEGVQHFLSDTLAL